MIVTVEYTSVFDGGDVVCTSNAKYDTEARQVFGIETAENAAEADNADLLTDEFITLEDGTELRERDGISFDYKAA